MNKKNLILLVLSLCFIFILIAIILFQISKSRSFQFFGEFYARVETQEKVVALTFDDGPTKHTAEVLKLVNEKKIPATFYVIGSEVEKYSSIVKQIVRDGHELGNHSYTHQRFLLKSQSFIKEEVEKTNDLIRNTGYKGDITFRPPYGKRLFGLPWYLSQQNIKTIYFDVEPDTYVDATFPEEEYTEALVTYTIANTKPGSIILLHPHCDSCDGTRKAIAPIIDKLKAQGYTFVTVEKLLTYHKQ